MITFLGALVVVLVFELIMRLIRRKSDDVHFARSRAIRKLEYTLANGTGKKLHKRFHP